MSNSFKITYNWEIQSEPEQFYEEDFVDYPILFICLRRFLSLYEGTFLVCINELDLQFDLEPDFSIIFEELPDVLETLMTNTDSPVELYFAEQGTDLKFLLERHEDTISIRFVKGLSVGQAYEDLPETVFFVPANLFLNEWVRFANAVLAALVALKPDLSADHSYQEYHNRLLAVV